jgi:hypothetical protein
MNWNQFADKIKLIYDKDLKDTNSIELFFFPYRPEVITVHYREFIFSIHLLYRIGRSTIYKFIPEVCEAICSALNSQ